MKRLLLLVPFILSGCVYPVHEYDRARALNAGTSASSKPAITSVDDASKLLRGWHSQLQDAATNRHRTALVASEVLYYGTLLMVGGSAAMTTTTSSDPIHIRNIGAGLGLGSSLFSSRYKVADQRIVFEKATRRVDCALDAMENITDANFALLGTYGISAPALPDGTPFVTAYTDIPDQVVFFIERKTVPQLRAALSAIDLGAASPQDLLSALRQWNEARTTAASKAGDTTSPALTANTISPEQSLALQQFLTDVPALPAALKLCEEQHPF